MIIKELPVISESKETQDLLKQSNKRYTSWLKKQENEVTLLKQM